jgi:hypothetical protein
MKQLKLSEEQLTKILEHYLNLVEATIGEDLCEKIFTSKVGENFLAAPASGKLEYHNCFVGGLVEHSLRVYKNLKYLANEFAPNITDNSIALVSLFHDFGKAGSLTEPYYIEQDSSWHQEKLGEFYKKNPNLLYMDTAQRSLHLLSHFGVPLTEQEYQAILIHDGQYIEANKRYAQNECMLALLLHQADMIACKQEEERWRKFNQ